jgi:hypothetical protein
MHHPNMVAHYSRGPVVKLHSVSEYQNGAMSCSINLDSLLYVFDLLLMAAVVDRCVFAVHGGLWPAIVFIETGSFADLCWSDRDEGILEWTANLRAAGWAFGARKLRPSVRSMASISLRGLTNSHRPESHGFATERS